ncbi:MAG TPA: hypothetical protein VFO52_08835 [Longimicrobiales bacterium]|nr:hypothetical protein [Longimicrobiales bacterium]
MTSAAHLARTACVLAVLGVPAVAGAQQTDPRVGLKAGFSDAGTAAGHMELVANVPRPEGFVNAAQLGDIFYANSDLAFSGNTLYLGSFRGIQLFDISNPAKPALLTTVLCPGGQGDVSIYRNLLFMSVEMPNGRVDCGAQGAPMTPTAERFGGVRIFDITDVKNPQQVASVQTCRGSHTHTLVTDPKDPANVYIYVSGASVVRSAEELAGCSSKRPAEDPNTSYFRIEVIQVPVNAPQNAKVVNAPRIFADTAGNPMGLWRGGAHGEGTQTTATTDHCHDITVYPEMGIAAGACSGNGILLDITNPANPKRLHEVTDPNFAYWHSATFNNDASKVLFTDEWGGGMAARCQATDKPQWGADAIFELHDKRHLQHVGYYKLPAAQSAAENCVAHNGSLIPVPGRDIMAQAWYQGGISIFDFSDPKKPVEIAYFDRGPQSETLQLGGHWSAYWYNGHIYASEITRGLDVLTLKPSAHLTQNEIDAATQAHVEWLNPQHQTRIKWPATVTVAQAYVDQLERGKTIPANEITRIRSELSKLEAISANTTRRTGFTRLAASLDKLQSSDKQRIQLLKQTITQLAK